MNIARTRKGFTIIELLIVVIVIGILAAAGLAKYQNFAETSRRKTCLGQIQTIENALAVWETSNQAFAENSKTCWGFSTRTGRLTGSGAPAAAALAVGAWTSGAVPTILTGGSAGTIGSLADVPPTQPTLGGPQAFFNQGVAASPSAGPLAAIIRDDKVWVCPSALSRYYGGEIQNVPDDYLDNTGGGVVPGHGGTPVGMAGHYLAAVAGMGNNRSGTVPIRNTAFPAGFITGGAAVIAAAGANTAAPAPQVPFKIVLCGCYGSFGPSTAVQTPGTVPLRQGGPVGPDGSSLNRHSARW